jgi:hypothetical protein
MIMKYKTVQLNPLLYDVFSEYCKEHGYVIRSRLEKLIKDDMGEEKYDELIRKVKREE